MVVPDMDTAFAADACSSAVADIATAAVWSYVHGYLHILESGPPLAERLQLLSDSHRLPACPQLLLLCPRDGLEPADRQCLDGMTSVGLAATFTRDVAGARNRPYGAHPVFKMNGRLVAVEPIGSLSALRVVSDAMARCSRHLPPLPVHQLASEFLACLRLAVARDERLRAFVRLVDYDRHQEGSMKAALQEAAVSESPRTIEKTVSLSSGGGMVSTYLAWSFVHGYLKTMVDNRPLDDTLAHLSMSRIVLLCPTHTNWGDSISCLDKRIQPVDNVSGVTMAGRNYGSLTLYSTSSEAGRMFALEFTTPLRALRPGLEASGFDAELYEREARRFATELRQLLSEEPDIGNLYTVLEVGPATDLVGELHRLADAEAA